MHNVNLAGQALQPPRHDVVVQLARADPPQELVRDAQFPARQSRLNPGKPRNGAMDYARASEHVRARFDDSADLLPSRVTDAGGPEFVRKRIKDSQFLIVRHGFGSRVPLFPGLLRQMKNVNRSASDGLV